MLRGGQINVVTLQPVYALHLVESRNSVPNGIYLCSVDSLLTTPSQWGTVNFLGKTDPSERLGRHKKIRHPAGAQDAGW